MVIADAPQNAASNLSASFALGSSTDWTALLVAFSSATSVPFSVNATFKWDDATAVAGTITMAQGASTSPLTMTSLGSFPLDSSGVAKGTVNPNPALPLTFYVTLINPAGTVVNSMMLFANAQMLQGLPHTFNPTITLAKSNAVVNSVTF